MAFPSVESTATTGRTGAETTSPINYPGTVSANALIIAIVRSAVAGAIGWPAAFTELVEDSSDASDDVTAIAYAVAVGNEDGTTFNVTHGSGKMAGIVYSITGAENPATQAPQLSTVVTGTSTLPDPGNLTPTGGAKDYLWLWLGAWEGEQTSPPAGNPSGYSSPLGASTGTGGVVATNVRVATAQRNLNAASEDPGSWTISASDDWSAWTMAVHPASVQTYPQTLTTNVVTHTATIPREMSKSITASIVGSTALMDRGLTFGKELIATIVASAATMSRGLSFGRTLTTDLVVSTVTAARSIEKQVAASVVSHTASILKSVEKAIAASVVSSIATAVKSISKPLTAASVAASAIMDRGLTFGRTLDVYPIVSHTATMTRASVFPRVLSAIVSALSTVRKHKSFGLPFLFTAANFGGSPAFYFEVYMRASYGTAWARLFNETDNAAVAGSDLSTTSATYVRLRSSSITLTDGKTYSAQFGTEDYDQVGLKGALIIVV